MKSDDTMLRIALYYEDLSVKETLVAKQAEQTNNVFQQVPLEMPESSQLIQITSTSNTHDQEREEEENRMKKPVDLESHIIIWGCFSKKGIQKFIFTLRKLDKTTPILIILDVMPDMDDADIQTIQKDSLVYFIVMTRFTI